MEKEMNICIAAKAFAALILDYEYPENKEGNLPALVSCRVLIDDVYQKRIHAESREKAVEMFLSGAWKTA